MFGWKTLGWCPISYCVYLSGPFSNRIGLTRSSSMDSIDSSNSSSSTSRLRCSIDGEWKVIASMQSSETGINANFSLSFNRFCSNLIAASQISRIRFWSRTNLFFFRRHAIYFDLENPR